MSSRKISKDTSNATSLPESECGHELSDKQDGAMTDKSGQEVAPVLHSPVQERKSDVQNVANALYAMLRNAGYSDAQLVDMSGMQMNDTSGRSFKGSSASVDLTKSLANKLQEKTEKLGSTLYRLRWSWKNTPSGRQHCQLVASALRTFGSDCTGWPTPNCFDTLPPKTGEALARNKKKGVNNSLYKNQQLFIFIE